MNLLYPHGRGSSMDSGLAKSTMVSSKDTALPNYPTKDVCWFDEQREDDEDDDNDEGCISPVSIRSPQRSGTHWIRFFPELSSHFSLVSPVNSTTHITQYPLTESPMDESQKRHLGSDSGRQTSSSLSSSIDPLENTSSCYSHRSSTTSLSSEPTGPAFRSPDALSIVSPTSAGVFEDSASMHHICPISLLKRPSIAESIDKPLPREPAIQLAPLSVRRSPPRSSQSYGDGSSDYLSLTARMRTGKQDRHHRPTLSQAAEDLESALAGLAEQKNAVSPKSLKTLDMPLQISRGNMDMVPSRRPPHPPSLAPPVDVQQSQSCATEPRDDVKQTKKSQKNKMSFSFTLPVFNRKSSRSHFRSLSSSDITEEMRAQAIEKGEKSTFKARRASKELEAKDDTAELPGSMSIIRTSRPLSVISERDLRLKLPRLQTKEIEPISGTEHIVISCAENAVDDKYLSEEPRKLPEQRRGGYSDEKIFVSSSKDMHLGGDCAGQSAPIPEMIYGLDGGFSPEPISASTSSVLAPTALAPSETVFANFPDNVILRIFEQVYSLDDLFHLAIICKKFYRVFKKRELELIKNAVLTMSAPAWELREMSPPWDSEWQILVDPDAPVPEYTPSLYLGRYAQDIYTLAQLKSLILVRCSPFLRSETISGLSGVDEARASAVDDAFWRIWAFCRIFGCGKNREGDVVGQLDWIDGGVVATDRHKSVAVSFTDPFDTNNVLFEPPAGFGRGNKGGISQSQLYDMTEIWTCLGVLLQPFHGKCREARRAGIFEGHGVQENDTAKEESLIEEWTCYVLSLGPSAVLNLGSICFSENASAAFKKARSVGLTKWECAESGVSRSAFLKEAVSRAYQPREETSHKSSRLSKESSRSFGSLGDNPRTSTSSNDDSQSQLAGNRRRQAIYAEQLRNRRNQQQEPEPSSDSFVGERPISNYSMVVNRLGASSHEQPPPLPVPTIIAPGVPYHGESSTQRRSQSPQPAGPIQQSQPEYLSQSVYQPQPTYQSQPVYQPQSMYQPRTSYQPQVRDPVDQAIDMMVHDLHYSEEDAKWALKITDTGEGINVNAAVTLLMREQWSSEQNSRVSLKSKHSSNLLSSVYSSHDTPNPGWRWA